MKKRAKNRWNVQIVFPGLITSGLQNRADKDATYDDVISELEDFVCRAKQVRTKYRRRLRTIAKSPELRAKAERLGILPATHQQGGHQP